MMSFLPINLKELSCYITTVAGLFRKQLNAKEYIQSKHHVYKWNSHDTFYCEGIEWNMFRDEMRECEKSEWEREREMCDFDKGFEAW